MPPNGNRGSDATAPLTNVEPASSVLAIRSPRVSIGIAEYPAHGDTPEELIASADAAMYRAKGQGRDRIIAAGEGAEPATEKKPRRRKGES
jgi:predicted signal transduction protein with EAL and GGDEF domain